MNKAQLLTLLNATPVAAREFTLPSGISINLRPCKVAEYLLHIVRVYESAAQMFLAPVKASTRLTPDEIRSCANENGEVDEDKVTMLVVSKMDVDTLVDQTMTDQPLVSAAFCAICMDHPGDKDVEAAVLAMDDDDFVALYAEACKRTWGDDPSPFYARVGARLAQARQTTIPSPPRGMKTTSRSASRTRR